MFKRSLKLLYWDSWRGGPSSGRASFIGARLRLRLRPPWLSMSRFGYEYSLWLITRRETSSECRGEEHWSVRIILRRPTCSIMSSLTQFLDTFATFWLPAFKTLATNCLANLWCVKSEVPPTAKCRPRANLYLLTASRPHWVPVVVTLL